MLASTDRENWQLQQVRNRQAGELDLHGMLRVGSTEIILERSHLSSQRTALSHVEWADGPKGHVNVWLFLGEIEAGASQPSLQNLCKLSTASALIVRACVDPWGVDCGLEGLLRKLGSWLWLGRQSMNAAAGNRCFIGVKMVEVLIHPARCVAFFHYETAAGSARDADTPATVQFCTGGAHLVTYVLGKAHTMQLDFLRRFVETCHW